MICEIFKLARERKQNPNLECGDVCKEGKDCPFANDDELFPAEKVTDIDRDGDEAATLIRSTREPRTNDILQLIRDGG